jgi:hypothetical protein
MAFAPSLLDAGAAAPMQAAIHLLVNKGDLAGGLKGIFNTLNASGGAFQYRDERIASPLPLTMRHTWASMDSIPYIRALHLVLCVLEIAGNLNPARACDILPELRAGWTRACTIAHSVLGGLPTAPTDAVNFALAGIAAIARAGVQTAEAAIVMDADDIIARHAAAVAAEEATAAAAVVAHGVAVAAAGADAVALARVPPIPPRVPVAPLASMLRTGRNIGIVTSDDDGGLLALLHWTDACAAATDANAIAADMKSRAPAAAPPAASHAPVGGAGAGGGYLPLNGAESAHPVARAPFKLSGSTQEFDTGTLGVTTKELLAKHFMRSVRPENARMTATEFAQLKDGWPTTKQLVTGPLSTGGLSLCFNDALGSPCRRSACPFGHPSAPGSSPLAATLAALTLATR